MGTDQGNTVQEDDKRKTTEEDSKGYNRANTNAQTRLIVSTFLGSICLGVFGVFLPNSLQITRSDSGSILTFIIEGLLGCASVFFLLMTATVSIVLVRLGDLDSSLRKSLEDGKSVSISEENHETLRDIIQLYDGIYFVYYVGLIAVLVSLPFMGFHVNTWIGVIILVAIFGALLWFRKSLRFMIFYKFRSKSQPDPQDRKF